MITLYTEGSSTIIKGTMKVLVLGSSPKVMGRVATPTRVITSPVNPVKVEVMGMRSREIVYPYIPDPDGEDEGGQASSSLAVSTRWISIAKLFQSGLATLAQRDGGE
ncbi:hypothetical protein GW17_00058741 [Ensete ventricosum]|nr:hypothetical protein GW17_00058741 [Ensete ventricosum]